MKGILWKDIRESGLATWLFYLIYLGMGILEGTRIARLSADPSLALDSALGIRLYSSLAILATLAVSAVSVTSNAMATEDRKANWFPFFIGMGIPRKTLGRERILFISVLGLFTLAIGLVFGIPVGNLAAAHDLPGWLFFAFIPWATTAYALATGFASHMVYLSWKAATAGWIHTLLFAGMEAFALVTDLPALWFSGHDIPAQWQSAFYGLSVGFGSLGILLAVAMGILAYRQILRKEF